jgi:hypothetical protein
LQSNNIFLAAYGSRTIATFKAYYIRETFEQTTVKTTGDDVISLTEFWKNYNIRHAIENIHHDR